MAKMEKQAKQTDRAVEQLGRKLDKVFGNKTNTQMSQQERSWRNVNREASTYNDTVGRVEKSSSKMSNTFRRVENDVGGLERSMRKLVVVTEGFSRILNVAKLPVMIGAIGAGIGILVKGVVALGGGLVALIPRVVGAAGSLVSLLPKITQLSGVAIGATPVLAGMGLAAVTVKLAFADLTKAMNGNKKALAALTPQGKAFLATLKSYKPLLQEFRTSAQGGLFAGLDSALKSLRVGAPVVNVLLRGMSKTLGGLAANFAKRMTTHNSLMDILSIGQAGTRGVGRLGTLFTDVASGMLKITRAAIPFSDVMTKSLVKLGKWFEKWATFQASSGNLARFLDRTRQAMTLFGRVIRDTFIGLKNIFGAASSSGNSLWGSIAKAAKAFRDFTGSASGQARMHLWFSKARTDMHSLADIIKNLIRLFVGMGKAGGATGNSLWDSLDRVTRSWARFANSVGGQYKMALFFQGIRESFVQISLLLKDLGVGVFQLGTSNQRGFPAMIEKLRTLVPILTHILIAMTNAFGGPMVDALAQIGKILSFLTGASGPISILLNMLVSALKVINAILSALKPLSGLITVALTFAGIAVAISKVRGLAASWGLVATSATEAAAAEGRAVAVAGGGAGRAGGGAGALPLFIPGGGGGSIFARAGKGVRGIGSRIANFGAQPAEMTAMQTASGSRIFVGTAARAGLLGGGATALARRGLGAVGRFALPVALISGALSALSAPTQGNFGTRAAQRLSGFASGATFGLLPRIQTGAEQSNKRVDQLLNGYKRPDWWHRSLIGNTPQSSTGINQRLLAMGGDNPKSISQEQGQIRIMTGAIRQLRGEEGSAATAAIQGFQARIAAMRQYIGQHKALMAELAKEKIAEANAASARRANLMLSQFGGAINVRMQQGMSQTKAVQTEVAGKIAGGNIIQSLSGLRYNSKKQYAEQLLGWLDALKQKTPELQGTYDKLRAGIVQSFADAGTQVKLVNDTIIDGSQKQWNKIVGALTSKAELARKQVVGQFTQMQQEAMAQLQLLGVGKQLAANIVLNIHTTGVTPSVQGVLALAGKSTNLFAQGLLSSSTGGHAYGGRIGGSGLHDRPMSIVAAPGEMIVNRHTEHRVNRMLGRFGTSLSREVGRERVPHGGAVTGGSHLSGVQIGQIVVYHNKDGDIKDTIVREVNAAFEELARTLDTQEMIGTFGELV